MPDVGRVTAIEVVDLLAGRGSTIATAESLTGGLVAAAITSVPGSSAVLRGGVVSYATDLKAQLLGVDQELLARVGAVHPQVAREMADGVRTLTGADYGLSTTGVAGPDPQDGAAVGTVFVAVSGPEGVTVLDASTSGDRDAIRRATVVAALRLVIQVVRGGVPAEEPPRLGR